MHLSSSSESPKHEYLSASPDSDIDDSGSTGRAGIYDHPRFSLSPTNLYRGLVSSNGPRLLLLFAEEMLERRRKSLSGTPLVRSVPVPSQGRKRVISTDFLPYADRWFSQP